MSFYDPYSGDDGLSAARPEKPSTAWMMTVADLFSLMLTFFVLLYSMSSIKEEEWDAISSSLMQRLNPVNPDIIPYTLPEKSSIEHFELVPARDLQYLYRVIESRSDNEALLKELNIKRSAERLTISLSSDTMFPPGSAALREEAHPAIVQLAELLSNIGNAITIEGHTDPEPIHNKEFPSNWELSMARAVTVATLLHEAGYPYEVTIYGLGSSRFSTEGLSPREAEAQKAKARRVDIIVNEATAE